MSDDEVKTTIDIDAPVQDVWEVVMDATKLQDWVTIHRSLGSHSTGKPSKGDEMEQKMALRGATFKVKWELAECEQPTHALWKGRGPARSHAETQYDLADNGKGGTTFSYRNVFKAPMGPLGKAASKALVGGLPEKEAKASLQALKELLEG